MICKHDFSEMVAVPVGESKGFTYKCIKCGILLHERPKMNLLDNDALQAMVDYSFGDQSGVLGGVPQAYMKRADIFNTGFDYAVATHKGEVMTLFVDNVRLYQRWLEYSDWMHLKPVSEQDRQWLNTFYGQSVLGRCAVHPKKKFIIFTAFEDTPIDQDIYDQIPENVIAIHAANAVVFGGKVHPFPHGIERKMYSGYTHHDILKQVMLDEVEPTKLLFVAHREDTGNRASIGQLFKDKEWATVTHLPYEQYLKAIQKHKFVLCPSGNGIESSRNWETLYMRRVPVFKDHPYLREMFKDFPALFVKDFDEVTEQLLKDNDHLFQQAQSMDMEKLSLDYWFNKAIK